MSDSDNRIKEYEDKFNELKSAFQTRALLHTEITVLRTETMVMRILSSVEILSEFYFFFRCVQSQ